MSQDDSLGYFDWAATSPPDQDILREALELSTDCWANPSSLHVEGKRARSALEDARGRAACALGVKPDTLVFTSGGTESDIVVLLSVLLREAKGSVVLGATEHPAVLQTAKTLSHCGYEVLLVPPDKRGIITAEAVASALRGDTALVSVMAVNNETGAIQPLDRIAAAIDESCQGRRRPLFHSDCVQAAGKIPLDLAHWGVDAASFSAHKIKGPRGIGAVYLSRTVQTPFAAGGQERGIRGGTENLFGAHALSLCLQKYLVRQDNPAAWQRYEAQKDITRGFIRGLLSIKGASLIPECRADEGQEGCYSPWIVQATVRGVPGQVMQRALDEMGFCVSTGSACSSGKGSHHVLDAMGLARDQKETSFRVSFGFDTTADDASRLLEAIDQVARRLAP